MLLSISSILLPCTRSCYLIVIYILSNHYDNRLTNFPVNPNIGVGKKTYPGPVLWLEFINQQLIKWENSRSVRIQEVGKFRERGAMEQINTDQ
jgi:hypothetical protein